ncbi:MAG: YidB family protein [Xanthomonadales bacterium]|jgi:uncharacterized protein YidB (DUF937 family)|nr:YidB family protein [Xanthomonadales bacterium]
MSILDTLMKEFDQAGGVAGLLKDNPQVAEAARQFLGSDSAVGPSEGLPEILSQLQSSGLGDAVASWLGGGENHAVSGHQLESALGQDSLNQFASQAGIDLGQAGAVLASLLPVIVDQLSNQGGGAVPESNGLDQLLGGLLGQRG